MLFIIKKLITPFIMPPGCFAFLLLVTGWRFLIKKRFGPGLTNLMLGALLWAVSTAAVGDWAIQSLEQGLAIPSPLSGDVIVLLGGGTHADVPDLSGTGSPTGDMSARILTTVRAQKMLNVPIIVSGGSSNPDLPPEAPVVARILTDLGVPREQIIQEIRSRDTAENARETLVICRERGFTSPLLVTSAYHMKRSTLSFEKAGLATTALPAQFLTSETRVPNWRHYLPCIGGLNNSYRALHEYLGILFYRLSL